MGDITNNVMYGCDWKWVHPQMTISVRNIVTYCDNYCDHQMFACHIFKQTHMMIIYSWLRLPLVWATFSSCSINIISISFGQHRQARATNTPSGPAGLFASSQCPKKTAQATTVIFCTAWVRRNRDVTRPDLLMTLWWSHLWDSPQKTAGRCEPLIILNNIDMFFSRGFVVTKKGSWVGPDLRIFASMQWAKLPLSVVPCYPMFFRGRAPIQHCFSFILLLPDLQGDCGPKMFIALRCATKMLMLM